MTTPPHELTPRTHTPPGFINHTYQREQVIPAPRAVLWTWLNTPETFTRQLWPYRVEFLDHSGLDNASGFALGVLNTHHGPFLNCAGVITDVDAGPDGLGRRRDLRYYYGAFILSPRLVRPTLLRFELADTAHERTILTLRVESDVRRWFAATWNSGQGLFWSAFFRTAASGARKAARATPA